MMNCPACGNELNFCYELKQGGKSVLFAYCGYGPCPSKKSNDGAEGRNHEEAYQRLKTIVEKEMEDRDIG